jgi:hypothetical protein
MKNLYITFALLVLVGIGYSTLATINRTRAAHATFDSYYAFRGCTQLLEKTDTYGTCKTASGQTIQIILIDGKWYLENDGPGVW